MSGTDKPFSHIHESVPQWLKTITDVEAKIAAMQSELAKVPASWRTPLRRKTGSVESIRDLDAIVAGKSTTFDGQATLVPSRKRKTASVLSGQQSGPTKYRSRTSIVVYYDGQIQALLEQLVRAIGSCRNMLRKNKMAVKLGAMVGLPPDDGSDDDSFVMARMNYRSRAAFSNIRSRAASSKAPTVPIERFDELDKCLEVAQSACERAAHQSLRAGDCQDELDEARKCFEDIHEVAAEEVAKDIDAKQEEAQEVLLEKEKLEPVHVVAAIPDFKVPAHIPLSNSHHTESTVVDIEVDDEEDDTNFVLPPVRLTSRVWVQSA